MEYKLKQSLNITGLIPAIVSVILFVLSALLWDIEIGFYTLGSIILFYSIMILYAYFRTKHTGTLISTIYMVSYGLLLLSAAPQIILGRHIEFSIESKVLLALTIILFNLLLFLNYKRKLKWRGHEILELAARNITETTDNFTERPLPTGYVDFKRKELDDFAVFFQKNLLGLSYIEDSRIVFLPLKYKNEYSALYNPFFNYKEKTWVAFSYNGNVSVHISKEDYLDYKEDLAFDQLCNSLNDLMVEFIKLFIDGKKVRIIDKMDNLRINVFT